jgi:hypothetical protein
MKTLDVVIVGETLNAMEFMLRYPPVQITGHPDVERARDAAHDVNAATPLSASSPAKKRLRSGSQITRI